MSSTRVRASQKTVTLPRFDPDEDFSDVDGDPKNEFALDEATKDPTRHYHWAHNNPDDIGAYTGGILGYVVEHYAEGGVRPKMVDTRHTKDGEAITKRDHVLVSCDLAKWEKRQRYERRETQRTNEQMFKSRQTSVVAGEHHAGWNGLRG